MKSTFKITNPVIIMVSYLLKPGFVRHRGLFSDPRLSHSTRRTSRPTLRETAGPFRNSCSPGPREISEELLFNSQDRVLGRLGDSKFDDGFSWNLDLLLGLGIETYASLPFLLNELAEAGQDEFTVLFDGFVGEGVQRFQE
jgi:hypothetical protein